MQKTIIYDKNVDSTKRLVINQGGTSSSKTWSILQTLLTYLSNYNGQLSISVVSETMPHLKRGAMRDFFNILYSQNKYSESQHNKTDHIYDYGKGKYIEFFSCDNPDKVLGPRRDVLFMNECINTSYQVFEQLEVRTNKRIFLDYNPKKLFWVHTEIMDKRNDFEFIQSTYLDAIEVLPPEIVKSIELRKDMNPNWWKVYGEGKVGEVEGLVFKDFNQVDKMPDKPLWRGLDFGFTNDPSVLIEACLYNGELYLNEVFYERGLLNRDIASRIQDKRTEIVADSAEPKSIAELRSYGINIVGADKGKDSVSAGIDLLQSYKINVTKRSVNLIQELRNYEWKFDRYLNRYLNEPVDDFNHAIDAARYIALKYLKKKSDYRPRYSTGTY